MISVDKIFKSFFVLYIFINIFIFTVGPIYIFYKKIFKLSHFSAKTYLEKLISIKLLCSINYTCSSFTLTLDVAGFLKKIMFYFL